jgi:putative protease
VAALKIEGRYKDADYVALTTAAYRQAVDEAWAGQALTLTPAAELQLEQVFSRGLGPHFVTGTNHQTVVKGRTPRHRGVQIGHVVRVLPDRVLIAPAAAHAIAPLKPGDGVVFDAAAWRSPEVREEGGRVYAVAAAKGGQLEVQFGNGAIQFSRIRPGDLLWRTHDPALDKAVRTYTEAPGPVHKQPLRVQAVAQVGEPLRLVWSLVEQPAIQASVASAEPLVEAANRGLDAGSLREQLGRLGNTAYQLQELELHVEGMSRAKCWLAQSPPITPIPGAHSNRPAPSPPNCTCWCARRSSWQPRWRWRRRPPASRLITSTCTACARQSSRCRRRGSRRASPARACSSRTNSGSSISCAG